MTYTHLPCFLCQGERSAIDVGSALCAECRRGTQQVTTAEVEAALARIDRSRGGKTPLVAWRHPRAPHWLSFPAAPQAKAGAYRVLVIPLDEGAP